MTLEELGMEYEQTNCIIMDRIHELRPRLKQAKGHDVTLLAARLRGLYELAGECKKTSVYLKEYYDGGTGT